MVAIVSLDKKLRYVKIHIADFMQGAFCREFCLSFPPHSLYFSSFGYSLFLKLWCSLHILVAMGHLLACYLILFHGSDFFFSFMIHAIVT